MTAATVMMALGDFRFGMTDRAYRQFARTAGYRWAKVDRIAREPALQYLGPDSQEIEIEGTIYPHFRGGLHQIDEIRRRAASGAPMMMVDGLGWVWRRWAVVRIEEIKSHFLPDGAPRRIEFTLTLRSYGPEAGRRPDGAGQLPGESA